MTPSDPYQGDTAREKRPTFLKGLIFLVILALVAGGLVFAAFQLRSAEGPKVAASARSSRLLRRPSKRPAPHTISPSTRLNAREH